jgi:hypothetical protein
MARKNIWKIRAVRALILAGLGLAPGGARAEALPADPALSLLDQELTLASRPAPDLRVALAETKKDDAKKSEPAPSLDFDLLGEAPKTAAPVEDPSLKKRRQMLNLHQGLGIGLLGLQIASTVTGQLNYNDKFGADAPNTDKYKATHKVVTYTNLAAFAVVGGIAIFAPTEKNAPPRPFGRTSIHKIGMALATVGMATQAYLGIQTVSREGYLDQKDYAKKHLVVGYATLAVMTIAVGALVF